MYGNTLNGRRNIFEVFHAWLAGKPKSDGAINTDGETIRSYGTAILARTRKGLIFNATSYSQTTTIHQNGIAYGLKLEGIAADHTVRDCNRGASPEKLVGRLAEMDAVRRNIYTPI